jgi:hypothetical protein
MLGFLVFLKGLAATQRNMPECRNADKKFTLVLLVYHWFATLYPASAYGIVVSPKLLVR